MRNKKTNNLIIERDKEIRKKNENLEKMKSNKKYKIQIWILCNFDEW